MEQLKIMLIFIALTLLLYVIIKRLGINLNFKKTSNFQTLYLLILSSILILFGFFLRKWPFNESYWEIIHPTKIFSEEPPQEVILNIYIAGAILMFIGFVFLAVSLTKIFSYIHYWFKERYFFLPNLKYLDKQLHKKWLEVDVEISKEGLLKFSKFKLHFYYQLHYFFYGFLNEYLVQLVLTSNLIFLSCIYFFYPDFFPFEFLYNDLITETEGERKVWFAVIYLAGAILLSTIAIAICAYLFRSINLFWFIANYAEYDFYNAEVAIENKKYKAAFKHYKKLRRKIIKKRVDKIKIRGHVPYVNLTYVDAQIEFAKSKF